MQVEALLSLLHEWWHHEDDLKGIRETQCIEFKRSGYNLSEKRSKLEFAKDVAAMSNAGGGLIVLGIATERDSALGRDVSSAITPLAAGVVQLDQIHGVARSWIYPPFRELEVSEWPHPDGRMLVSLRVPAVTEAGAPLLVHGAEVDGSVRRTFLGIAVRHEDRIDYLAPDEVHTWLNLGRQLGASADTALQVRSANAAASSPDSESPIGRPSEEADAELAGVLDVFSEDDWPILVLQAWPNEPIRLEHIHDPDGVAGVVASPPTLRVGGFNLAWDVAPHVYGSGGIGVSVGRREGLRITPTGVVTFFGSAGPDLLGWGMEKYSAGRPSVNPTTLSELVFEFCRFFRAVLDAGLARATSSFHRIVVNQHEVPLYLTSGRRPLGGDYLRELTLRSQVTEMTGPSRLDEQTCEALSGILLARLYGRFGMGRRDNPYLDPETGALDPGRIIRLEGPGI